VASPITPRATDSASANRSFINSPPWREKEQLKDSPKMKSLAQVLDELAAFEPTEFPLANLYLNAPPDQHGRDHFDTFVRQECRARAKT
jgi:hypothetical protein